MAHGSHPDNLLRLEAAPPALVVFNSQSLADEVGWSGCSVVVHPPVDVESFAGVKPGNRVTLINLSKEKGGHLFWDLAVAMPHVQFLGVRGGYGEQISNKRKNVRLIDPTADMAADVYGQTRMLLMPSERETWGRTAVEAMAAGIPVIAHPTPGLCESLGPAGTFVDRDDTEGWVAQINRLSSKSEWAVASHASSVRAAELDPAPQLARFAKAVEAAA